LLRPNVRFPAWAVVPRFLAADRGAGLLRFAVVYALLLLVGLRVAWGADVPREWIGLAGLLPVSLVSVFLALLAGRSPRIGAEARRAWWLIAGAQLTLAAAFAVGGYKTIFGEDPRSIVAGILSLTFYPLFLWGLLSFPGEHGSARRKRVYWLDTATALVAGAIVFWYVVPALALAPQPLANRLLYVVGRRAPVRDGAIPTIPRADVPENHERRRAMLPALADVRAVRLLAHGMQPHVAHELLQAQVVRPAGGPDLEPRRLARAEGHRLDLPMGGDVGGALGLDRARVLAGGHQLHETFQ
jgi:hypothetical protein